MSAPTVERPPLEFTVVMAASEELWRADWDRAWNYASLIGAVIETTDPESGETVHALDPDHDCLVRYGSGKGAIFQPIDRVIGMLAYYGALKGWYGCRDGALYATEFEVSTRGLPPGGLHRTAGELWERYVARVEREFAAPAEASS